jgi:hypothetical protein
VTNIIACQSTHVFADSSTNVPPLYDTQRHAHNDTITSPHYARGSVDNARIARLQAAYDVDHARSRAGLLHPALRDQLVLRAGKVIVPACMHTQ